METVDFVAVIALMVMSFSFGMLYESLNSFKHRMKDFSEGK